MSVLISFPLIKPTCLAWSWAMVHSIASVFYFFGKLAAVTRFLYMIFTSSSPQGGVFKGTSHKVAKHWWKTEGVLLLLNICNLQLYVVFLGMQKDFDFSLRCS